MKDFITPIIGTGTSVSATLIGFFQHYNPLLQGLSFIVAIATGLATIIHLLRKS